MSAKKTCPVCGWELKRDAPKVTIKGKPVAVCCDDCGKKLKASPAKYAGK